MAGTSVRIREAESEDYILKFMTWNWLTGLCGQLTKFKSKGRSWASRAQAETVVQWWIFFPSPKEACFETFQLIKSSSPGYP